MEKGLYSGNNILALLTLILIIFSVWSFWVTNYYVELTGQVAKAGYARVCIEYQPPSLVFDYPEEGQVISRNMTIRSRSVPDPKMLKFVKFYLESGPMRELLGNVSEGSGGYFNLEFNTTKFYDRNCQYKVFGKANFSACTNYGEAWSGWFSINNIDQEPKWNNFRNNLTTNFSKFTSWISLTNVTIGVPNKGVLYFRNRTINLDNADLDTNLSFDHHWFQIGSIPCVTDRLFQLSPVLTFLNMTFRKPRVYRNGQPCPSSSCIILNQTNNTLSVMLKRSGPAYYQLIEGSFAVVSIWDDTDGIPNYYVNQPVTFYANLTDFVTGKPISGEGVYCKIRFFLDYEAEQDIDMDFNPESKLYEYTRSFPHPNKAGYNDQWAVYCNATALDMDEVGWLFSNFRIVNRGPVKIADLPNETWAWNTILTGRDLDDYIVDPDNDPLNFTIQNDVDNIYIKINGTTHVPVYVPSTDWYGNRSVVFVARDPFNASANSNEVFLEVVKVPVPKKPPQSPSLLLPEQAECKPNWQCGNWSECKPSGIQTRECIDLNYCNLSLWVPETVRNCTYIPTCFDKIKNQGELGVDCGGPCKPCPTCFDGIQNQGELGVDCGGPCEPCPTCFDGIQNQGEKVLKRVLNKQGFWEERVEVVGGEEGIDCGGPCEPCPTCTDGIKNGDEEGVDCGGSKCPPCEKAYTLESPRMSRAFWSIFIISFALAAAITVLVRHHLKFVISWIIARFGKLLHKKHKTSLFDAYLSPYLMFMSHLSTKAVSILELKEIVNSFFVFVFGNYSIPKLSLIISYHNYLTLELQSRLKELLNELFVKQTSIELKELLKRAKEAIRDTFIQSFVASGESVKSIFDKMVLTFPRLLKSGPELAEAMKEELYQLYLRLSLEEKGKVYKTLCEIDKTEVKPTSRVNKKVFMVLLVFGLMGSIGLILGPALTGYWGLDIEKMPLEMQAIPDANIHLGESFVTKVLIDGGTPPFKFSDDSQYFNIDAKTGVISFVPGVEALGRNFATITVIDATGSSVSRLFKFTVYQ